MTMIGRTTNGAVFFFSNPRRDRFANNRMGLFRSEEDVDFGQFADTTCVPNDIDTLLGDALPRFNLNWVYQWSR